MQCSMSLPTVSSFRPRLPQPRPAPHRLDLHPAQTRLRPVVERFIGGVYADRYDAQVPSFMPQLVSRSSADGELLAAAGYRSAAEPLFLERYLDVPVDQLIAQHGGGLLPPRARIVEVGHLAARRAGHGRALILQLASYLNEQRVEWVVSTLTEELRHLFERMGVQPLELGRADPTRLGAGAQAWGRYYAHRPMVLAGHLPTVLERLAARGLLSHHDET